MHELMTLCGGRDYVVLVGATDVEVYISACSANPQVALATMIVLHSFSIIDDRPFLSQSVRLLMLCLLCGQASGKSVARYSVSFLSSEVDGCFGRRNILRSCRSMQSVCSESSSTCPLGSVQCRCTRVGCTPRTVIASPIGSWVKVVSVQCRINSVISSRFAIVNKRWCGCSCCPTTHVAHDP